VCGVLPRFPESRIEIERKTTFIKRNSTLASMGGISFDFSHGKINFFPVRLHGFFVGKVVSFR
jgi:hypothetical protein